MRAWAGRQFPRAYRTLAARIDPAHFQGLPLTLIALAAACLVLAFAGLIEEVFESEELAAVDRRIVVVLEPLRDPVLIAAFTWLTELGSMATLMAVAVVATGFLWAYGPANFAWPVWLTVAGAQLTTWAGKFIVDRPRPDFVHDITAVSPSFPSAHAAGAMAVYGIIAYVLVRNLRSVAAQFEVIFWTAVLIGVVAVSRVFLSVHHPSDVAGGIIVGTFWLLAGVTFAEIMRRPSRLDE